MNGVVSRRVAGRCPMGCGETLFLAEGGHVTCSLAGCPSPCAAGDVLADPQLDAKIPRLAKLARVERHGRRAKLFIDDKEFPFCVAEGGVSLAVNTAELPAVVVTVLADRVEVVDDIEPQGLEGAEGQQ